MKFAVFIILGVLSLFAIIVIGGISTAPEYTEESRLESYRIDAKYAGQEAIRRLLKTPSTAEFTTKYTILEDGYYYTGGHVDAQNSFGATIRSDYSVVVARLENGDYRVVWWRFEGEEYGVNPGHIKAEEERQAEANRRKVELAKQRRELILKAKEEESKKAK